MLREGQWRAVISIHALREEGDRVDVTIWFPRSNFYPRPPRGGRPQADRPVQGPRHFYPRPPRGGRPTIWLAPSVTSSFLSTPSARRATSGSIRSSIWQPNFYPRPPRGGRHAGSIDIEVTAVISIHALREEGDVVSAAALSKFCKFLSTPSARRATLLSRILPRRENISIHALREEGDPCFPASRLSRPNFYPRPPRGGRLAFSTSKYLTR